MVLPTPEQDGSRKGSDMLIKVKISYEREEELTKVLTVLHPLITRCKRTGNQDGRFKKAYAELETSKQRGSKGEAVRKP